MNTKLKKKKSKAIVDFAMIAGLLGCFISTSVFEKSKEAARNGANTGDVFHWGTSHCIISLILVVMIFIHIWQHWGYIKAVISKGLYLNNKITTLISLLFIATVVSFTLYLSGFTMPTLHFHSLITHLFVLLSIIHLVMNFKKLLSLVKKSSCQSSVETVEVLKINER
jgi:hypothetical protein